jgi:hypothetical protein
MTLLENAQSSLDPFHFGNSRSRPSHPPEGSVIISEPGKWTLNNSSRNLLFDVVYSPFASWSITNPKMAESIGNRDSSLQVLPLTNDKISEYICKTCSAYESQLNKVLEELESARAITDILQREVPTITTTDNMCNEQTTTKEWTTVSSKSNSSKPKNSNLCRTTITDQYIMTANKFTPLNNLQTNNAESNKLRTLHEQKKQIKQISTLYMSTTPNQHKKGMKIPTIINERLICGSDQKPTTRKKEERKSSTGTRASHKVKIIGESHLSGIAPKID